MLAFDSLVLDLIFQSGAEIDPDALVVALGGAETAAARKILDPDMQDPRFEMELSPSFPFRQQAERRLMIIDDSVAPMRSDPNADPVVPLDLRPEKERLIAMCTAAPIRLGRVFALGTLADAVLVARSARDLRAIALLPWVLDPSIDVEGKRRAGQLTKEEFETKIAAYEKRLEELDEKQILANLGPASFERRGDLLVVDVLEADGTWDIRNSLALEEALAAIDKFSLIPGAPARQVVAAGAPEKATPPPRVTPAPTPAETPAPAAAEPAAAKEPAGPPISTTELGTRVILVFPPGRFNPSAAAALGRGDFEAVLGAADDVSGPTWDRLMNEGGGFVAPLEFLSEVFVDGVPLSKPQFENSAESVDEGARALEVHCPRYGTAVLVDIPGVGRFVSSETESPAEVVALVRSL